MGMSSAAERHKKRRLTRFICIVVVMLAVLLVIGLLVAGYVWYLREKGRAGLREHAENNQKTEVALRQPLWAEESEQPPEQQPEETEQQPAESGQQTDEPEQQTEEADDETEEGSSTDLKKGQIRYGGKVYQYKDNLLTILCMGIDSRDGIDKAKIPGAGGQADCVILAVLDDKAKKIQLLNISRDTMVPIDLYDMYGSFVRRERAQITLQYAYGDGRERSCELMEQVVSDLFYGIPIHGYCALAMSTIADLNDAIGGVTVTVPDELAAFVPTFTAGETITLQGQEAVDFVHSRNIYATEMGSNNRRIARQKMFVKGFVDQAKKRIKEDITLPAKLYQLVEKQMVTSISLDQAVFLCTEYLDCDFSMDDMISVEGTITKENVYEEFNVDEKALYELILKVFYEEVEQ